VEPDTRVSGQIAFIAQTNDFRTDTNGYRTCEIVSGEMVLSGKGDFRNGAFVNGSLMTADQSKIYGGMQMCGAPGRHRQYEHHRDCQHR